LYASVSSRKTRNQEKADQSINPLIIGGMGLEIASTKGGTILVEKIMRG